MIVGAISKPLSVTYEQLGIETPRNDRACDNIIIAIGVRSLGYVKEQSATTRKSSSGKLGNLHGEKNFKHTSSKQCAQLLSKEETRHPQYRQQADPSDPRYLTGFAD